MIYKKNYFLREIKRKEREKEKDKVAASFRIPGKPKAPNSSRWTNEISDNNGKKIHT